MYQGLFYGNNKMLDESIGLWGLFISAFISSTIAPGGSEAVLAYLISEKEFNEETLGPNCNHWQYVRCSDYLGFLAL